MNILGTIFQWLGYAQYNASGQVATSGQPFPLQCDENGNLYVSVVGVGGGSSVTPYYVSFAGGSGYLATPLAVPPGNTAVMANLAGGNCTSTLVNGAADQEKKTFGIDTQNATGTAVHTVISSSANIFSVNTATPGTPVQSIEFSGNPGTKVELTWWANSNGGAGGWFTG